MYEAKKILLATNEAGRSRYGEKRAALLSDQLRLRSIDLLTVKLARSVLRKSTTEFSHAEIDGAKLASWLEQSRQRKGAPAGLPAPASVMRAVPDTVAEVVVETARNRGADLTIFTPHRRNSFLELLAASDSRDIVRRSRNSLLLVHREPLQAYRKVLIGVDFSAESHAAARVALSLAPGAQFTFVHAYRLHDENLMREFELPAAVIGHYLARGCQQARERLEKWILDLGAVLQSHAVAIHSGAPIPVIDACARHMDADLIVVGRQGLTRMARFGLGDVARRMAAQGPCDVLIGPSMTGMPTARIAVHRFDNMKEGNR